MIHLSDKVRYEIELVLNQNLFEKKKIPEALYHKTKENLLNLIQTDNHE